MAIIALKDRFDIDDAFPLPEFDSPTAKAYHCAAHSSDDGELIALICDPEIPIRVESMEAVRGFQGVGLLKFVDSGVVNWPESNRRKPALILHRPAGRRIFNSIDATITPFSDENLINSFLTPAVSTLRELSGRGITHRNLRADNLFYSDASESSVIVGECISAPPGYNQPLNFESIESGMADQTGRGEGGVSDDLFALGVTSLCLLIGRNPVGRIDDPHRYMLDRINQGSYASIVGSHRIQMNMMELLRGLLADDMRERWTLQDIELWLGGLRLTPKQVKLPQKAGRPLTIGGTDHENVRSAAYGFAQHWSTSAEIVKGQDFENWLRRSLNDDSIQENITQLIGSPQILQSTPASEDARLVSRISICLDQTAPLRYKGFSFHIDGIGPTLSMGFSDENVRDGIRELINGRLLPQWMSLQSRTKSEVLQVYATLEKMPGLISQSGPGYGLERCLYELNPYIHCMSSMLEHLYITKPEELIPALEAVAQGAELPPIPMDRHVAAFLAARSSEVGDRILRPLSSLDERPAGDALKVLNILARVQSVYLNGASTSLCRWFQVLTTPAVNTFHNLKVRQQVEDSVKRAVETGILGELQKIFDDTRAVQRDEQGYARAQHEHSQCSTQVAQMNLSLQHKDNLASELGEQVAAVVSGVMGSIGATVAIAFYMM